MWPAKPEELPTPVLGDNLVWSFLDPWKRQSREFSYLQWKFVFVDLSERKTSSFRDRHFCFSLVLDEFKQRRELESKKMTKMLMNIINFLIKYVKLNWQMKEYNPLLILCMNHIFGRL